MARRVLAWALPLDAREYLVDELDEMFQKVHAIRGPRAAGLWYVRETLSFSARFLVERTRERLNGGGPLFLPDQQNRRGPVRGWFEGWSHDLVYAARRLVHAPAYTAIIVLTLALAVGANAAIFSIVDAVLINPLAFKNADRLVSIRGSAPGSDLPPRFAVGPEFFVAYRDGAGRLDDIGMFQTAQTTVRSADHVDRLFVAAVTTSVFSTLEVQPHLGRLPNKDDDAKRTHVIVISHWLWRTWFASDPAIIGRVVEVSGQKRVVIGVMEPDFRFPDSRTALWIRAAIADERRIQPGRLGFQLIGRMKPGVRPDDLATELATVAKRLPARFGGDGRYARLIAQHEPVVHTLEEAVVGDYSRPLWIILGTVAIVFLIACANLANLFVVRTESRRRDLAVRSALGAGRAGLIRSQMAEALLLAVLGGLGAVAMAWTAVPLLVSAAPEGVPNLDLVALTPASLLLTSALSMLAACLFGLLPALRSSRPVQVGDLRQAGGGGTARGSFARHVLVVAQTACALVLLVAAGLLARSFWELSSVKLGYSTDDIFTFQIAPARPELRDGPSFARFHEEFMERIAALPGVESVGVVNELPLDEASNLGRFATDESERTGAQAQLLPFTAAGGDYFTTMGIPVVSGRGFDRADHTVGKANVLVSRSAARTLWPNETPLGKRVRYGADAGGLWLTVIGVVEDVRARSFRQEAPDAMLYLPLVGPTATSWAVGSPAYVVKSTRGDGIANDIRTLLQDSAPESPLYRVFTMEALADRSLAQLSFTMLMLAIASGLALILGAVGLYGVLSYVVAHRTREIAVRLALGAEVSAVRRMVVWQGSRVALIGVVLGLAIAISVTRLLESLLFGVGAQDAPTFLAMSGLMLAVAMLASYIPAYRASAVDPVRSLRIE